jgi:hypothetical protein
MVTEMPVAATGCGTPARLVQETQARREETQVQTMAETVWPHVQRLHVHGQQHRGHACDHCVVVTLAIADAQ